MFSKYSNIQVLIFSISISWLVFYSANCQETRTQHVFKGFENVNDTIHLKKAIAHLSLLLDSKDQIEVIAFTDYLIQVSERLNYKKAIGGLYIYKSNIYLHTNRSRIAKLYLNEAIRVYKNSNDLLGLAEVYHECFLLENRRGNFKKSTFYLSETKRYLEKIKDSFRLGVVYNNLGYLYYVSKDFKLAESAYLKSIEIKKRIGKIKQLGRQMNNLAIMYLRNKEYDKALAMVNESLLINKEDNLVNLIAHSYTVFGDISIGKKEFRKAKKYYDSALSTQDVTKKTILVIDSKQQLGYIAYKLGDFDTAEKLLRISRNDFSKIEEKPLLLKNYKYSSELDSARGKLASALKWQYRYQKLSDEITTEISEEKIKRTDSLYKNELGQIRTIDKGKLIELRNEEEIFRNRIIVFIIFSIIIVSILFIIWILKTKKEREELITKLNESNEVKNKIFSIISHDLKNEIFGLESSLNLMQDNDISTEEFEEIVPLLADRTNQTSILLNNLLNWSKSQMKELKAKPVNFDINVLISEKFHFFESKASDKSIKLINKLEKTYVHADKDMIAIVAQNLIANAIKFCKSGDLITLFAVEKRRHYEIGFSDTGIGIDPSNLKKLFAEEMYTTQGTGNESGTGLGLKICKELLELNKGKIRVESTLGEGSTFYITLPKAIV